MLGRNTSLRAFPRWKLLLGLLCVALVILGGTLAATHTHDRENSIHADCSLCVAAHVTVQLAPQQPVLTLTRVFTRVESTRAVRRPHLELAFDLYTRPPPVHAHLS